MQDGLLMITELNRAVARYAAMCALVSVGVPDQLANGPLTVAELAHRSGARPEVLARLLRSVVATGMVRNAGHDAYQLTNSGRVLLEGPGRAGLEFHTDPEMWRALGELTETVRTGRTPFAERHGSLYAYLSARPKASAAFDQLMAAIYNPVAGRLAKMDVFSSMRTLVDAGGGNGMFLAAILTANPGLRGTLLETERVLPSARRHLIQSGVGDRCELVAGDFFRSVPAGADGYLLAHIIHNWDDNQAVTILGTIRAVLPDDGVVLLVEAVLPEGDSPHPGRELDVHMLAMHEGMERNLAQYNALMREAGLCPGQVTEIVNGEFLITASRTKSAL